MTSICVYHIRNRFSESSTSRKNDALRANGELKDAKTTDERHPGMYESSQYGAGGPEVELRNVVDEGMSRRGSTKTFFALLAINAADRKKGDHARNEATVKAPLKDTSGGLHGRGKTARQL